MKVKQKEGVYSAVVAFAQENDIDFADGQSFEPSKEQRLAIVGMVTAAMEAGEIELSEAAQAKYNTTEKLHGYCNGLTSNWLRKDTRLNGGEKYEIKNPGSRAGSGDKVITELRKLKKTLTQGTAEMEAVENEINSRLATIQTARAKKVEINAELIPEELKHLVSSDS